MGPKKGRRVRKIEVSTDSVPESVLGDTAVDIQQRREKREAREREEAQKPMEEEARVEETHSSNPRKVTQKQRLEERWYHHSHDTRRGT